ncbi:FAD-binding oxidoreductase [Actinomadura rupiterrae]|uniref:FAD-binding oxidoreductase n=1 Tax=Actinomadura rupiterrae TaxID=559627 RepID=UPI0020A5DBBA|nr:FAD-binding oxidoreductase [Actinomadura rupiterrae]MCP2338820.1 glycolate oxidase FAD binding subunit [Actinomadura rupiterrae]
MLPLDAFAKVCADVRPGEDADQVDGLTPPVVAAPATLDEASAVMRTAAEHGLAVVPSGTGSKLGYGRPVERCDVLVTTRNLDGIIKHSPGDLTLHVEAGLTFEALRETEADGWGQHLALRPPENGTIGGAIATDVAGPGRLLHGSARDLLIGITTVRADGTIARAGGKVVKNVAGYDLGKLYTGSLGTLGLIVDATFRMHPAARAVRVAVVTDDPGRAVQAVLHSQVVPRAIEIDRPAGSDETTVAVEAETETPDETSARLHELLGGTPAPEPDWWNRLPEGEVLAEIRSLPARLPEIIKAVKDLPLRGSAGAGRLYTTPDYTTPDGVEELREALKPIGARVVLVRAPLAVRKSVDVWGPLPTLPIMRRVKDQFDPDHRLSPGRFAEGV